MNRLEMFFIEHIAPYGPFGTTIFQPKSGINATAETNEVASRRGNVTYLPETKSFRVPTGTTATLTIDGVEIIVRDYRERPGHTAGAMVIPNETEKHHLDEASPLLTLAVGIFKYFNR